MLPSSCSSLIAEVPGYMSWCFSMHLLFVEMLAQVSFRCPFAILCMPVVRKRPASALASTSGTPGSEVVHGQESLPSLAELQAITDVGEFRQRAVGLGLVIRVRKSDGSGWKLRAKADIMDDYKRKLDEVQRLRDAAFVVVVPSQAHAFGSAPQELAASSWSVDALEASQATSQGPTHGFASGSPGLSPSEALTLADQQPSLPSVAELEAITSISQFRTRASELGLVVWKGVRPRSKADVMAEYKQKLAEVHRSTGSDGPAFVSEASEATGDFVSAGSSSGSVLSPGQCGLASSSLAFVLNASEATGEASAHDFVSVGSVVPPSSFDHVDASVGVDAYEGQPSLPSVAELEAIAPISEFRKRACELGLVVYVGKRSGSGCRPGSRPRSKADIIAEYKRKLEELQRSSTGSGGPALSSVNESAASSTSAVVCQESARTVPGSAHDFVSAGSPSGSALSFRQGGLPSHGFTAKLGPCQPPSEDATSARCGRTAAASGFRVRRKSKRDREVQKAHEQSKRGKFMKRLLDKRQWQRPEVKEKNKIRLRRQENKDKDKLRLGTAEEKRKTRLRMTTAKALAQWRKSKSERVIAAKKIARAHTEKAYANRLQETVEKGGTWQQAAHVLAEAEGRSVEDFPTLMPPSFVGLHDSQSLRHISEMYGFFKDTNWCTCVGCWRAWYHVPDDFSFGTVKTKAGGEKQWYQPSRSMFLRCIVARADYRPDREARIRNCSRVVFRWSGFISS